MVQVFPPVVNTIARVSVLGVGVILATLFWVSSAIFESPYATREGVTRPQPVAFSHARHVGALGLDCRYCHAFVESSATASLPSTKACMGCHGYILPKSPLLEKVRTSFEEDLPIRWRRVHDLPDFVHFDHSIHVNAGVGCSSCHGRVDQMPLMAQGASLQMDWCLKCHMHPESSLRPLDKVFDMKWLPGPEQSRLGGEFMLERSIHPSRLTDCSRCHQ